MELIGRQHALELIASLLEDARGSRAHALALVGEPGIGKSALLDAAERAASGFRVLRAGGSESERDYAYAGLLALARPLRDDLEGLPPRQREAMEAVLAGDARRVERFAVAVGTLGLLAAAAERSPVLVAVDDVQWLDVPTSDALAFAVRRLEADAVAAIFASRPGGLGELGRSVDLTWEIPPLDDASALAVLTQGDPTLAPEARARLLADSHGNPLALLELPRRLTPGQRTGAEPLPPSPVAGASVEQAFAASATDLPEATQLALAAAALLDEEAVPELDLALRALGLSFADLEPAERDELVAISPGRVSFRHPLVRAAVLRTVGESGRRRAHQALAGVLPPGERRALHLAEAAVGPDAAAASELIAAAARAPAVTAASLLTRAAALTSDGDERARALVAAGEQALLAGRQEQARGLAAEALRLSSDDLVRGRGLVVQGRIARISRPPAEACALLLDGAAALAGSDRAAAVAALGDAFLASLPAGDPGLTLPLATRLLELVGGEPGQRPLTGLVAGIAQVMAGKGVEGTTTLERLLASAEGSSELTVVAAMWLEDFRRGIEEASRVTAEERSAGRLGALPRLLLFTGFARARLGRFDAAYAAVSEGAAMAEELGQQVVLCDCLNVLAGLEARLGFHERCVEHGERALELAKALDLDWYASHALLQLALAELATGRADGAIELIESAHASLRARGVADPGEYSFSDLVEAYVRRGEPGLAARRLAELEALVEQVPRPYDVALAARSAALVASDAEAAAAFEHALAEHTGEMPFELARTHLLFGERLRRMGERRRARDELRAAEALFEGLGADGWADRCRRELVASGARLRRRGSESRDDLTPQELQVALQVGRGLSNREIAQTLFLSPKTVEFHLTRIYRKLGLHARADLVERFAEDETATGSPRI